MHSALTHLECSTCGTTHDADAVQTLCTDCGLPLLSRYDLEAAGETLTRDALRDRPRDMWRWREILPVRNPSNIVTLGEERTPLLNSPRLAEALGLTRVLVKDETRLPTGTFKARGLVMAISRAKELGITEVAIPSAGNAAEAAAAYAARAGMSCYVAMPKDAPQTNMRLCAALGARVVLVDGLITDAGALIKRGCAEKGWFALSTFKEPYRVEGKKTMGLELAEQLGWSLPDVILYPTGGGTGLVGMWKAFDELEQLGFIDSARPRMVAVQTEGCAPVVRAFEEGAETTRFWEDASTIAGGLRVPNAIAGRLILSAVRDSGGTAVAVSDDELRDWMLRSAALEGLYPSPESAAVTAAAARLAESGWIEPDEQVVLFQCGGLLKHIDLIDPGELPLTSVDAISNVDLSALFS